MLRTMNEPVKFACMCCWNDMFTALVTYMHSTGHPVYITQAYVVNADLICHNKW